MGLLSFFQRSPADQRPSDLPGDASAEPDAVAAARTRARRRLIGAAVLLGVGIVGFPLLFETQPRPVPVNVPIEIPRKDGAPPLAPPAPSPALSAASAAVVLPEADAEADAKVADAKADAKADSKAATKRPPEITERAADAGRELAVPAPVAAPVPAPAPAVAAAPASKAPPAASRPPVAVAEKPADKPAEKHADKPTDKAAEKADAARAQALLNGQAASAAASTRVVVQVGAYTEPGKLKEAREKVEKLGFKTYTQVVEVDGAKRTRVRIGPFATKAEADKAAARIKASGLPAAILSL